MTTVDEARAALLFRIGGHTLTQSDEVAAFEAAIRAECMTEGERYEWQKDKQRCEAKLAALREAIVRHADECDDMDDLRAALGRAALAATPAEEERT